MSSNFFSSTDALNHLHNIRCLMCIKIRIASELFLIAQHVSSTDLIDFVKFSHKIFKSVLSSDDAFDNTSYILLPPTENSHHMSTLER